MTHPSSNPSSTSSSFTPIAAFLCHLGLGQQQSDGSLTLWPLLLPRAEPPPPGPEYTALGTALANDAVLVDEVSEGGEVPRVRVSNRGDVAVLFLFGEEIRGAKQNRVANASFLVPPQRDVVLDVSCVEAGRWHRSRGARFEHGDSVLSPSLRRSLHRQVTVSRARRRGFHGDQGKVWDEIQARLDRSGVRSETRAYSDYRESRAAEVGAVTRSFRPLARQVGFVAAIGGAVVGLEAIGRPEVFATNFSALLRAYALDAVDPGLPERRGRRQPRGWRFEAPETFLAALAQASCSRSPSLGSGDDLRLAGPGVSGCALAHGGLVHLMAFPANA